MAAPVDNTGRRTAGSALGFLTQGRDPLVPDVDFTDNTAGIAETAGAMFMLHTITGELIDELRTRSEYASARRDPSFNPYSYYLDNREKFEDIPELEGFLRTGAFHHARSPEEFEAQVRALQRELARRDTIARGGFAGLAAGTALSFLDVSTAVPIVGWAAKAGTLAKAGIVAANAGAITAAQEAALHGMQTTRTREESLEAIGVSTLLGGGLGAFVGVATKGHPLHPATKGNPLDLSTPIPVESSVGAMKHREKFEVADHTGLGFLDNLSYWMKTPTAVARVISKVDPETAQVLQDLSNTGIVTKDAERGIAIRETAEEIFETEYETKFLALNERLNRAFYDVNAELQAGQFAPLKEDLRQVPGINKIVPMNPISQDEWNRALFHKLNNPDYRYSGVGAEVVNKHLDQAVQPIRQYLDMMFKRGVELGLFTEDQKLDNYLVQRWMSDQIALNPAKFEAWLLQKFVKEPDEEWLREFHGMSLADLRALPPGDPKAKAILSEWNTEVEAAELRRLELAAEAAEADLEAAQYAFRRDFMEARKVDTRDRKVQFRRIRDITRAHEASLQTARERLEQLRLEEKSLVEAATAARTVTLERLLQGTDRPQRTPAMAEANTRALTIAQELRHQEAKVARMERRLARLQAKAAEIEHLAEVVKARKARALETARASRDRLRKAQTESRRAKSKLKAATARKSVAEQAEEIARILQNRGEVPHGVMLFKPGSAEFVAQSGRVKHRGLLLDPEDLVEAVDQGWLDTSVPDLLWSYTRDVGSRLALLERFGSVDLKPQVRAIQDRFKLLKERAKTDAERKKLKDMEEIAIESVTVLRNRVLGIDGIPENPESALMYAGRMMRQVNFLRWMGGVMLSSVTDLATSALTNGGTARTLKPLIAGIKKHAKGMKDEEVRALLFGAENILAFSRQGRNMMMEDLQYVRGFGTGKTRQISAALEGSARALSEKMSVLNGMSIWNSRLRYAAGQIQLANILRDAKTVARGGKLPDHRLTEYARFGMDLDDLKGVAEMIEKHGQVNEAGLIDPNGGAWMSTKRGAYLHRRMMTLLHRATREAVIAPTAGDLPPFMTRAAGRMIMQFQSFGFAAVNKYLRNLRYKPFNGQAWETLMSVTLALAMGTAAYVLKEAVVKGNELSDKPADWVFEAVDRSGLPAFLMPLFNAGRKLAAPALEEAGIDFISLPSRYRKQGWLTSFFGPSLGLIEDVSALGTALSQGDLERAFEKGKRLAPFQNLFYLDAIWRRANGLDD